MIKLQLMTVLTKVILSLWVKGDDGVRSLVSVGMAMQNQIKRFVGRRIHARPARRREIRRLGRVLVNYQMKKIQ